MVGVNTVSVSHSSSSAGTIFYLLSVRDSGKPACYLFNSVTYHFAITTLMYFIEMYSMEVCSQGSVFILSL